jgi:hypothetical protein
MTTQISHAIEYSSGTGSLSTARADSQRGPGSVQSTIERHSKLPGHQHVAPGLLHLNVGCAHLDDPRTT